MFVYVQRPFLIDTCMHTWLKVHTAGPLIMALFPAHCCAVRHAGEPALPAFPVPNAAASVMTPTDRIYATSAALNN